MPTFNVEPHIKGGSVSVYRELFMHRRCSICGKYALIGCWAVREQKTWYTDGTVTITREYFCPKEAEAGKL